MIRAKRPNTMFGLAEYPNGQYVMFNVRNVNYDKYERQVYNEYYLEDGSKIVGEGKVQNHSPRQRQTGAAGTCPTAR